MAQGAGFNLLNHLCRPLGFRLIGTVVSVALLYMVACPEPPAVLLNHDGSGTVDTVYRLYTLLYVEPHAVQYSRLRNLLLPQNNELQEQVPSTFKTKRQWSLAQSSGLPSSTCATRVAGSRESSCASSVNST